MGRVVYIGTYPTPEQTAQLAETVCRPAGAIPLLPNLPEEVEVSVRQTGDRVLYFILNTTNLLVQVQGVVSEADLLRGRGVAGGLTRRPKAARW